MVRESERLLTWPPGYSHGPRVCEEDVLLYFENSPIRGLGQKKKYREGRGVRKVSKTK